MNPEFKNSYKNHIEPFIESLNNKRKLVRTIKILMFSSFFLFLAMFAIGVILKANVIGYILVGGFIFVVIVSLSFSSFNNNFKKTFKNKVMYKLVETLDEPINYSYREPIDRKLCRFIKDAKLFENIDYVDNYHTFAGEDYSVHEVNAYYKTWEGDDRKEHTVFRGIIIATRVNENPDVQYLPKGVNEIRHLFDKYINQENFIKSEDPMINQYFHVKGKNNNSETVKNTEAYLRYLGQKGLFPFVSITNGYVYFFFYQKNYVFNVNLKDEITEEKVEELWNSLHYYLGLANQIKRSL